MEQNINNWAACCPTVERAEDLREQAALVKAKSQKRAHESRYDSSLSTAQISAKIRDYLREHYKGYKWRVRSENYSGGSSISVTLVSGPVPVMSATATRSYISTSSVGIDGYSKDLTPEALEMLRDVVAFAVSYNRSDSDGMIDYFDERFYLRLHVGDFGAPYIVKENKAVHRLGKEGVEVLRKQAAPDDVRISNERECKRLLNAYFNSDEVRLVEYSTKAIALVGNTRPLAAKLKELGGRFNPRLSCGAGWIFSKRNASTVCAALGLAV